MEFSICGEAELSWSAVLRCGNTQCPLFCSCDLDPGPMTFKYELDLYRPTPDMQTWTSYVKSFESYRPTDIRDTNIQTDRQREWTEIINHAASRVVKNKATRMQLWRLWYDVTVFAGHERYREFTDTRLGVTCRTVTGSQHRHRRRQSILWRRRHLYVRRRRQLFPVTWPPSRDERPAAVSSRHHDDRLTASLPPPAEVRRRSTCGDGDRPAVGPRVGHLDTVVVVVAQPSQLVGVSAETLTAQTPVTEQATKRHAKLGTERRVEHEIYRWVDNDQQIEHVAGDFQQMQLL